MASAAQISPGHGPRRSILDLAPLELHCMNALWSLQEGSVRQIQQALAPALPRAYTTIMTIMDRLARKGVVTRFKKGRAYLYRASLTAEQARGHAVEQVVEGFFDGSTEALAAHLSGSHVPPSAAGERSRVAARPAERSAAGGERRPGRASEADVLAPQPEDELPAAVPPARGLDASLL